MISSHETKLIYSIIQQALSEDLDSEGDITSQAIFTDDDRAEAVIRSKEPGILSGAYLIEPIFNTIDRNLSLSEVAEEGSVLETGEPICHISGPIRSILSGERTVLNFLQRLSGIATQTAHFVSLIQKTGAKLLDTRKTTPTLRLLEKKAVLAGGGKNHRFGLFDMILIKDTHVKAAGGPSAAIRKARKYCRDHPGIKIEVEVQTIDEFNEAVTEAPDRIMLDNMSVSDMALCTAATKKLSPTIELEASGNIGADTIRAIAETGVDYISSGAITHSARSLDLHLVLM